MKDSYLKEFDAVIESVNGDGEKEGKFVVLDNTAFYPNGGGQPHDTGKIITDSGEYDVVFVGKFGGKISHEVSEGGLKVGDKVHGIIDWERRYKLMRMHSASHVLCGMFHNELGAKITGNQLNVDKSRIDFNIDDFDRELIQKMVDKSNELIAKGREIKIYFMPKEEAMKIEGIVKLAGAMPPKVTEMRIVEINNFDLQADGGTHVRNTSEIGKIVMGKLENKGKSNRRVYFELN